MSRLGGPRSRSRAVRANASVTGASASASVGWITAVSSTSLATARQCNRFRLDGNCVDPRRHERQFRKPHCLDCAGSGTDISGMAGLGHDETRTRSKAGVI